MTNLLTIFTTTILIVAILTGVNFIAQDLDSSNMDIKSQQIISELNNDLRANHNSSEYEETGSTLTANSSFEDVDPFARQYLEDKSEVQNKEGFINNAGDMPDLMLKSIGIEQPGILLAIKAFIVTALAFIIGLALYKAVRTGEVN